MKRFILIIVVLVFCCGCNEVQEIRGLIVNLNDTIDDYQDDTHREIDRVQNQLDEVSAAAAAAKISGDDAIDALNALRAANVASSGFNPYAGPIDAVIAAVIALAGGGAVGSLSTAKKYERSKRKYAENKLNKGSS